MDAQSAQGTILVVDDNEMNRDMLSRRLARQGYEVITAEDGKRALDLIGEQNFDLVLLDIMMPKMNGYEVLEQLKNGNETRYLPVIMISAVDDLDSVVKCIELGAEDYLFKPFNPVLLKARVEATLEKKRLRDQDLSGRKGVADEQLKSGLELIEQILGQLLSGDGGTLNERQSQLVNQIRAEADHLLEVLK